MQAISVGSVVVTHFVCNVEERQHLHGLIAFPSNMFVPLYWKFLMWRRIKTGRSGALTLRLLMSYIYIYIYIYI